MLKPLRILVAAPSATGKDTLFDNVLDRFPNLHRTKSWTTKPPDGQNKYHHVSKEEFLEAAVQGHFLEHNTNFEYFYGTYIANVPADADTISDMDAQAALGLKVSSLPIHTTHTIHTVFILPPDFGTLERRHRSRGRDTEEQIKKRLKAAHTEIAVAEHFEYRIVNDDITDATRRLRLLIMLLLSRAPIPPSFNNPFVLQKVRETFKSAALQTT